MLMIALAASIGLVVFVACVILITHFDRRDQRRRIAGK